jgi:hypothetical protein
MESWPARCKGRHKVGKVESSGHLGVLVLVVLGKGERKGVGEGGIWIL